jgi:sterol desaturase/sphingolipid hydroxylase (fatty acid hydroxylase superfamily)
MEGSANLYISALPALIFVIMALAERARPRRALVLGRMQRWSTHALFFVANRLTVWLLARLVAVPLVALWAAQHGYGLLNAINLPLWAEILIAFVALDFIMWFQHLATHKIPFLWRMHKVHHADPDMDVSTALRFHPFEIIVSTLWKALCVAALGVPALVFLAFEAWLGANALFNHSNINLPPWLDRLLRPFLVTPDMHLVHHSTALAEQQSNYGFALTLWDRLFGTYRKISAMGRDTQPIGLEEAQDHRPADFLWSAKLPLL